MLVNSGIFAASGLLTAVDNPLLIGALVTLVLVNLLFFFLMGAPTRLGRRRTDEIEGLKRYLTVAEKDRMNMAGAPKMSPQHFESLLPYAVALGVEKPWSRAFEAWLATAVATGAVAAGYDYAPTWYRGGIFDAGVDRRAHGRPCRGDVGQLHRIAADAEEFVLRLFGRRRLLGRRWRRRRRRRLVGRPGAGLLFRHGDRASARRPASEGARGRARRPSSRPCPP